MRVTIRFVDPSTVCVAVPYIPCKEFLHEQGWWLDHGEIFVDDTIDDVKKLLVAVHEFVEWYLEKVLGYSHQDAHAIASRVEVNLYRELLCGGCI